MLKITFSIFNSPYVHICQNNFLQKVVQQLLLVDFLKVKFNVLW